MRTPPLDSYLRPLRRQRGLSQKDVARLLGGTESRVCRHERWYRKPSLEDALAYAYLYGSPVEEVFAGIAERVWLRVKERAKELVEESADARRALAPLLDDEPQTAEDGQ